MQICENIHEFKGHGNILSLKPWTDCQGTPIFFYLPLAWNRSFRTRRGQEPSPNRDLTWQHQNHLVTTQWHRGARVNAAWVRVKAAWVRFNAGLLAWPAQVWIAMNVISLFGVPAAYLMVTNDYAWYFGRLPFPVCRLRMTSGEW